MYLEILYVPNTYEKKLKGHDEKSYYISDHSIVVFYVHD